MKRIIFAVSLILALTCAEIPAFAQGADGISVSFSPDGSVVTIKGKAAANQEVFAVIYRPFADAETIDSGSGASGISNARLVKSDGGGDFVITYKLRTSGADQDPTGLYSADIKIGNTIYKKTFNAVTPSDVAAAVELLNAERNTVSEAAQVYNGIKDILFLPGELYDIVDGTEFYDGAMLAFAALSGISNAKEAVAAFEEIFVLEALNASTNGAEVKYLVDNYNGALGFDLSLDLYTRFVTSDILRNAVFEKLSEKTYGNYASAGNAFKAELLLSALNNMLNQANTVYLLNYDINILSVDFSGYNAIKNKTAVDIKMANGGFADLADVKTKFALYVAEQSAVENSLSSAPGKNNGGNGGGGGGAALSFPPEQSAADKIKEQLKNEEKITEFSDLGTVPWAFSSIYYLKEKGIINGRTADAFEPNALVKREEFVKMLLLALNVEIDGGAVINYSDCDKDAWYYIYVANAAKLGIVNGYGGDSFGVSDNLNRQDACTLVYRGLKLLGAAPDEKGNTGFSDAEEISGYAIEGVTAMKNAGIINGLDDGRFAPLNFATRAEAAKIIFGIVNYLDGEGVKK
jgi:hypothetical protein